VSVSGRQTTDDTRAGDGAVYDWDYVCELGFEDGIEVL
jgi:hypothetical protein